MRGLTGVMVFACVLILTAATFARAQSLPVPTMEGLEGRADARVQPEQIDAPANSMDEGLPMRLRDPFWPVGYIPRKPEKPLPLETSGDDGVKGPEQKVEVRVAAWDQARARLDLRGVSSLGRDKTTGKPRFVAVMAGRLVEEGDTVSLSFEGQVYRWKVVSLSAAGVKMVKLDVRAE